MASPSGESELALALISSTTTPSGENQASPPQAPARMQRPAFLVAEDDPAASALTLEPLFVEYEDSNFLSFARVQRVFASFENCVPWETGRRRPDWEHPDAVLARPGDLRRVRPHFWWRRVWIRLPLGVAVGGGAWCLLVVLKEHYEGKGNSSRHSTGQENSSKREEDEKQNGGAGTR